MIKNALLIFALMLLTPGICTASEDEEVIPYVAIPVADDLAILGKQSQANSRPILLVVSQTECPYCELLKEEIIRPMIRSGDYEDRIYIRELNLDAGERVVDFNGLKRSSQDVASDYRAWLTPTVLFLNNQGKQIAKKIRGVNTVEMYPYYLDQNIDKAVQQMRR